MSDETKTNPTTTGALGGALHPPKELKGYQMPAGGGPAKEEIQRSLARHVVKQCFLDKRASATTPEQQIKNIETFMKEDPGGAKFCAELLHSFLRGHEERSSSLPQIKVSEGWAVKHIRRVANGNVRVLLTPKDV